MTLPLQPFLAVWALLAMNIASPGPNVLNTMTTAMGSGRLAGFASAAGVALGVGVWCLGMTLGITALFQAVAMARTALTLVAIGLLLWFASRYFIAAARGFREGGGQIAGRRGLSLRGSFLRSLSVNVVNPKALTTWVVILSIFPVARAAARDIAILCAGASVIAFLVHVVYALLFSTAPAARAWVRLAPWISLGVGLFFTGFAAKLILGLFARQG